MATVGIVWAKDRVDILHFMREICKQHLWICNLNTTTTTSSDPWCFKTSALCRQPGETSKPSQRVSSVTAYWTLFGEDIWLLMDGWYDAQWGWYCNKQCQIFKKNNNNTLYTEQINICLSHTRVTTYIRPKGGSTGASQSSSCSSFVKLPPLADYSTLLYLHLSARHIRLQ